MENKKHITICACASRLFIDKEKVAVIAASLRKKGYPVSVEPDLCKKVIQKSSDMEEIASGIILACYPRAIRAHLDWLNLKTNKSLDIRNTSVEDILGEFQISFTEEADCAAGKGDGSASEGDTATHTYMHAADIAMEKDAIFAEIKAFPVEEGTDAWNPVLDKEKCTECGKCHDFCLFGVYTIENKKVRVAQPQKCKNNCPACARMCPGKAIIFPKYEKSPINGGMSQEETFDPEEMDKMYRERLRMRLQQRRANVSLLKK